MPDCIYCRAVTTGAERVDHPLLRALGVAADQGLPPGACCDDGPHGPGCNEYLKDLDQHVCNHNHLASMIVLAGPRGHRGRLRREMYPGFQFDIETLQGRLK